MRLTYKKKSIAVFLILLMVLAGLNFYKASVSAADQQEAPDAIIVKFKPGTSEDEVKKMFDKYQAKMEKKMAKVEARKVKLDPKDKKKALAEYKKDPKVEYAEPDYKAKAFRLTNDPSLSNQWGMYKIEAANTVASAWDVTGGSC